MLFKDTSLHPTIKECLDSIGFSECTPIQEKSIEPLIEGKDISGLAQTGTGKTGAFLLPLIHRLIRSKEEAGKEPKEDEKVIDYFKNYRKNQFVLILVPTRELADQVHDAFKQFSKGSGLKSVCVYGGVDIESQKKKLQEGFDFLIATPGRLIDLYKSHQVDFKQTRAVIFDEADRLFDMGFKDDMVYLLQRIPDDRQFLVFSATINFDVLTVAYQFGSDPVEVQVDKDKMTADNVNHSIFHIGNDEKPAYLLSVLKKENPQQTIIFSNFRHQIEKIVTFLNQNGIPAMGISSLLNQSQRNRVLSQFKAENKNNIMVATDVAARGLDIKNVDLVINFELPDDAENYVHRIGRTGRAGEKGKAFSLVSDMDIASLQRIETYLKDKVEIDWLDDQDIEKDFKAFPVHRKPAYKKKSDSDRGNKKRVKSKKKHKSSRKSLDKSASENKKPYKKNDKKRKTNPNSKKSQNKRRPNKNLKRKTRAKRSPNAAAQKPVAKKSFLSKLMFWK